MVLPRRGLEYFRAGAFGQRSLGITVFGGMLAALLVGTFFIPGFYAIVQILRERVSAGPQARGAHKT